MKHILATLYLVCTIMAIGYWITYGRDMDERIWVVGFALLLLNLCTSLMIFLITHPKYKP